MATSWPQIKLNALKAVKHLEQHVAPGIKRKKRKKNKALSVSWLNNCLWICLYLSPKNMNRINFLNVLSRLNEMLPLKHMLRRWAAGKCSANIVSGYKNARQCAFPYFTLTNIPAVTHTYVVLCKNDLTADWNQRSVKGRGRDVNIFNRNFA